MPRIPSAPTERSHTGYALVLGLEVDRAGGKSRPGATTVERRRLCVTDLCHQVVSDERHLLYGDRLLARISHRKVARTTMEALNSGTETEFPLWRNRAVCRF